MRTIIPIEEKKEEVDFDPRDMAKGKDDAEFNMQYSSSHLQYLNTRDLNATYDTHEESQIKPVPNKTLRVRVLS